MIITPDTATLTTIRLAIGKCRSHRDQPSRVGVLPTAKAYLAIRTRLQIERQVRELALFNLAIDGKLRGCDLVAVRVHDA